MFTKILIYLEKNKLNKLFNKIAREININMLMLHKKIIQSNGTETTLGQCIIDSKNYTFLDIFFKRTRKSELINVNDEQKAIWHITKNLFLLYLKDDVS